MGYSSLLACEPGADAGQKFEIKKTVIHAVNLQQPRKVVRPHPRQIVPRPVRQKAIAKNLQQQLQVQWPRQVLLHLRRRHPRHHQKMLDLQAKERQDNRLSIRYFVRENDRNPKSKLKNDEEVVVKIMDIIKERDL